MKKEIYLKPTTEVIKIVAVSHLAAGSQKIVVEDKSGGTSEDYGGPGAGGTCARNHSFWDDEIDEDY